MASVLAEVVLADWTGLVSFNPSIDAALMELMEAGEDTLLVSFLVIL